MDGHITKLEDHIDVLEERVRYYRAEWEAACEREVAALALVTDTADKGLAIAAEITKERDDLHRMHCLDLDALLVLTERADAAEAKLADYAMLKAVANAAIQVTRYDKGDGGSRLIFEADLLRLDAALDDWRTLGEEEAE